MALLRPVPPFLALALAVLLAAPPRLDLSATAVDPAATAAGLRARVGPLEDWSVAADDTAIAGEVAVSLRSPDGRSLTRRIALTGATQEDRSRELAASLALLIEQWDDPPSPDGPQPEPPRPALTLAPAPEPSAPLRGWLGLGPRLELGRSRVEGGLDLQGGVWLLREHLQPLASVGWSAMARDGLSLHTIRFGAGLAAGAPLVAGRLWLGGYGLTHAAWTRVHDRKTVHVWASSSELGGIFQVRGPRWLVGVRTGVELALPELRARGTLARLNRGPLQWVLGVSFGLVFG